MPEPKHKVTWEFAYNDEMTELAVILKSDTPMDPDDYIKAFAAWLEYCKLWAYETFKDSNKKTLESDPTLN